MHQRVILMLLLVSSAACGLIDLGRGDCETNPAASFPFTLPPSATDVQERCAMNFVNPSRTLTFSMSPDDLETLQQSTPIREWVTDASAALIFDEEAARMESLLVGNYADGAYALEVLIDTSDPQLYRVYFDIAFVD